MSKILVIEDQNDLREEIVDSLRFEGYIAIAAENGEKGLELAIQEQPDLIICDINMPGLSGYDVLSELRSLPQIGAIPFLFLTARVQAADIRHGMNLGADDYLTKPFAYVDLLAAIRSRLQKYQKTELALLRNFSLNLVHIYDQTRLQIAQQLHDDVSAPLTGLNLLLKSLEKSPSSSIGILLQEAYRVLENTVNQIEGLQTSLARKQLDYLNILPALLWLFNYYREEHQLEIDFQYHNLQADYPQSIKRHLYDILDEALKNTVNYAKTSQVRIQLTEDDNMLHCVVSDDGLGFDADTVWMSPNTFGLIIMRERSYACHGTFRLTSALGAGTTIEFSLAKQPENINKKSVSVLASPQHKLTTAIKEANPVPELVLKEHVTIAIADENDLIREGLKHLLEATNFCEVLGSVGDLESLLILIKTRNPQIILVDIDLPQQTEDFNLLEMLSQIEKDFIILSGRKDNPRVWEALQQGARGCVLKRLAMNEIVEAVSLVQQGERFISPALSQEATDAYIHARTRPASIQSDLDLLTLREREILEYVAKDYQNADIADKLVISIRTVETHRANMMRKLNLRSKSDLIRFALKHGIISIS